MLDVRLLRTFDTQLDGSELREAIQVIRNEWRNYGGMATSTVLPAVSTPSLPSSSIPQGQMVSV